MLGVIAAVRRRRWLRNAIVTLVLAVVGGAATAGSALASPFTRGDVFLTGSGSIQEFTPAGQLLQTIANSNGAGYICFDPSGSHLVAPGVGLFSNQGQRVASSWATVADGPCVADGSGHVYVLSTGTISEYTITGAPVRSFAVGVTGVYPDALALAPDDCTAYYSGYEDVDGIQRFNVCTGTPEPAYDTTVQDVDDLRVLPDLNVIWLDDSSAQQLDPAANPVGPTYDSPFQPPNTLRYLSLDPDGTSLWASTDATGVVRFDIATGQVLADWGNVTPADPTAQAAGGQIALYGPPLLGDTGIERHVDSIAPGSAEVFAAGAGLRGTLSHLEVYIDATSAANRAVVGIYGARGPRPGTLLGQATIANPHAGSWNVADLAAPIPVSKGMHYWIGLLAPRGAGTLRFRDVALGGGSQISSAGNLAGLPSRWLGHALPGAAGSVSAYGS